MKKYPFKLFLIGVITNIFFHFSWLFVPSVVLLIIGVFVKPCLYLGLIILLIDIILSIIEQLKIRNALLNSENNQIKGFVEALGKEGNWMENVKNWVDDNSEKME